MFIRLIFIKLLIVLLVITGIVFFIPDRFDTGFLSDSAVKSLDILGYHKVYNDEYRHRVQNAEQMRVGYIVPIKEQEPAIEDMGRIRKKNMRITEENRKTAIVVVDGRAWDIEKTAQRVRTNNRDGDARFVLGGYYILKNRCAEAAAVLQNPEPAQYTEFSIYNMYAYLGYAYYRLGVESKAENNSYNFFSFLAKEQQAYIDGFKYEPKNVPVKLFKYHYALTFIDLGLYLEQIGGGVSATPIQLPRDIVVKDDRGAFECALKVLLSFKKPDNTVYEKRAYVYKKLGIQDKALEERKRQGDRLKSALYEKQRAPIRKQILTDLENRNLLSAVFKDTYEKGIRVKYSSPDKNAQRYLDSLLIAWSKETTRDALARNAGIRVLSSENKLLLRNEIYDYCKRKLSEQLRVIEVEYLWKLIEDRIGKKDFRASQALIKRYGSIIASSHRGQDFLKVKQRVAAAMRKIELREEREARRREEARKRQEAMRASQTRRTSTKRDTPPAAKATVKIETPQEVKPAEGEEPKEEKEISPMAKQVGLLIDDLIAKKDYVGAYRGLVAYEKILKESFGPAQIEKSKGELERFIRNEQGNKFLKKLQKDLRNK